MIKLFGEAPLFKELFLQLPQLLIQQKIGLMNQAEQSIGGNFGRSALDIGLIVHPDVAKVEDAAASRRPRVKL
jgi:hypothetical protein